VSLLHHEDFAPGSEVDLGEWTPTAAELAEFAREWDPRPHFVADAAAGTAEASGWHALCMWGRLYVDGVHLRAASMGGGGMEGIRFLKPVHAGERLRARVRVVESIRSRSRPERGTTLWEGVFVDDAGDDVLRMRGRSFFRRRDA
jgi:acyl dehydratase